MPNEKFELNEQQLSEASGAFIFDDFAPDRAITNSKGEECGWYVKGKLKYKPCEKCGKPTHHGATGAYQSLYYCDPCDRHYYIWVLEEWHGTEDELKAASM